MDDAHAGAGTTAFLDAKKPPRVCVPCLCAQCVYAERRARRGQAGALHQVVAKVTLADQSAGKAGVAEWG